MPGEGAGGVQQTSSCWGGWVGTLWESGCKFHRQQGSFGKTLGSSDSWRREGWVLLLSMEAGVEGGLRTRESSRSGQSCLGGDLAGSWRDCCWCSAAQVVSDTLRSHGLAARQSSVSFTIS